MLRLKLHHLATIILLVSFLVSCTKKSEMPVWEISKPNHPKSYLVGTINVIKKEGNEKIVTPKISQLFDSSTTFITQIDIINSDFLMTKNQIEIGMNKTIKDILSTEDFNILTKLKNDWDKTNASSFGAPDSARIKLLFYLQDILYQNKGDNFYFEQYWMKQAMASKKNITGLESYQKHYRDLSQVTLPEQIEFMKTIKNLEEFKTNFNSTIKDLYFEGEYEKIYSLHLDKFSYNKTNYGTLWVKKHRDWATTIDSTLSYEKCFISMDIKHLFGKENFLENLLSKGYNVEKIQ